MIYQGNNFTDLRGNLKCINDFNFKNIKRFYHISNHELNFVRAWHGHKKESKYFYATSGKFLLGQVNLNTNKISKFFLNSEIPQIIHIPKNHANGFMNLSENASIMVFSDRTLKQSIEDDIRFPHDKWNIWDIRDH